MKRTLEVENECDFPSRESSIRLKALPPDGTNSLEKRSRSGSPPFIVGPFLFNSQGSDLQEVLFVAEASNLPGVHRMAASDSSQIRLWSPHWSVSRSLQTNLKLLMQAIDGKCVFVFDLRKSDDQDVLQNVVSVDWLLAQPIIARQGVIVSKLGHPASAGASQKPPIPFIQDPEGSLASLCKFHEYLGPSAVCVSNGEVVSTTMLSRSAEILAQTLEEWRYF